MSAGLLCLGHGCPSPLGGHGWESGVQVALLPCLLGVWSSRAMWLPARPYPFLQPPGSWDPGVEVQARSMLDSPGLVVFLGSASPALSCKGDSLAPLASSQIFLEEFVSPHLSVVLGGAQPTPSGLPSVIPCKAHL